MIHVVKGNSGLDGKHPATEQRDLNFLIATTIMICNLDEYQLFRFTYYLLLQSFNYDICVTAQLISAPKFETEASRNRNRNANRSVTPLDKRLANLMVPCSK
jgi:hypothetical protein